MISIFDYQEPVEFLKDYIQTLPDRERRGVNNKLAKSAGIFPSYLSQILAGKRHLNLDQALGVAEFLRFKKGEKRYFLLMVEKSRAATFKLKEELETQLLEIKQSHDRIAQYVNYEHVEMTDQQLAQFFSTWTYAAVRLATALPGVRTVEDISKKLNLPQTDVRYITNFLLQTGLCVEKNGKLQVGPQHTHLDYDSVHSSSLHRSWRLKAMDHRPSMDQTSEVAYSLLTCLSKQDALKVRSYLLNVIADIRKISDPSESDTLYAFNLDWFKIC